MTRASAPPAWRDPWAWASLLAVVPLVLHSLGAPLGEPVADDFDYLHRALFGPRGSLFDGYGSPLYWRPLGRQVYFGLLAPSIAAHPTLVPILHAAALALIGLILYRAFRPSWPGPLAAAMATFVLMMEATRMLLAIPTYGEELSALLFAAVALHEAARGRMATALAALTLSLLGKEIGATTALLLPWLPPAARGKAWRTRLAWSGAAAGVLIVWGAVYLMACRTHGMRIPHEVTAAAAVTPWHTRFAWACRNSARAMFSLTPESGTWDGRILGAIAVMAVMIAVGLAVVPAARARAAKAVPWIAWGLAWFLAASAASTEVFPTWSPNRVIFAGIGFGVAITALSAAVHPALAAILVAVRLLAFAVSAGPPTMVAVAPPETGTTGFPYLARMQRHVRDVRTLLQSRFPALAHGAQVGLTHPPRMTEYAFRGSLGLQVWYRDTTLRVIRDTEFGAHPEWDLAAIVTYQEETRPQVMLIDPAAMRHYLQAGASVGRRSWQAAADELTLADSLQLDRNAHDFLGRVAGRRAFCRLALGRMADAERDARGALAMAPKVGEARYTLAAVLAFTGRRAEARRQLDTLIALYPGDRGARALRDSVRSWDARALR